MALFAQLSAIICPIFICAAIGFFLRRTGQGLDPDLVTTLVYKISVPCLIIATFSKVVVIPQAVASLGLASIFLLTLNGILGALLLRIFRLPIPSYLPAMTFSLVGSMGLPVCLFAYGEEGLAHGLVAFTITSIGTFTAGAALAAGRVSVDQLLKEPAIWAALVAIIMIWTGWKLPVWMSNTTWLLGGIAIPLQLISLGASLAQFEIGSLGRALGLTIVKLGLGFGLGVSLAELLGLSGIPRAVLILQATMPVAVSNYMFAVIYKREPTEVAGMVIVSTALTAILLPLILAWLLTGG